MDAQSLANLRAALAPDQEELGECEVWPQHWDTVRAFVAVGSQWRVVVTGGGFVASRIVFVGLDYLAVRTALDAEGMAVTPALWRGLRVMEAEACRVLNGSE